jgi:hypothetical protein
LVSLVVEELTPREMKKLIASLKCPLPLTISASP